MSSEGQSFNDSGVENVGDTNPVTDNKEPQPIEMERMDKPKHDVVQTATSNNESKERSKKKEDDSVSKSASPDEEKERARDKPQEEDDVIKEVSFTEQSTDLNIVKLTTTFDKLEIENKELKQCVFKAKQDLSQEIEKNRKDLNTVIEDKIKAVSKSAEAEEVMLKQKSLIEEKTHHISNLEDRIRQMKKVQEDRGKKNNSMTESIKRLEQQAGEREKTIKAQKESIKRLEQQAGEREKTIKVQKESVINLNKDLNKSNLELRKLQSNEKGLQNALTRTENKLAQTKDRYGKQLKEMDALQLSFGQDLSRINDDNKALRKQLNDSQEDVRRLTLRLSKIAGANLAFQNPNIADLGDPHRPTKLSERFSELYDNQWTDAFEQLDLQDDEEKIKRLYAILKKLDGHCLYVCCNYDAAVKESLTNLTVTSKIKMLKPERTQEAENDTGSPSENGVKIPSEKDTTFPLQEESKEEMTENVGLCNTYLWHKKETEDIGGGCKMIKYKNDIAVKCISPESMTGSECTGHVPAEGNKTEKSEKEAEENEGVEEEEEEEEEEDEGKGDKTEVKMESGSLNQTGQIEAKKKIGKLSDENNEYNPDVNSDNESNEAAPGVTKDKQDLKDDTDCKKEANNRLANLNDHSAEFKSDFNLKTEGNECTDDVSQHDVEPQNENQTKQAEHIKNVIDLKFDFDTLTNSHKQTISEIRRIVHTQLEDQVVKAISQAVLEEMELPRETGIVSYVEECTKICWLARLHDPPVYIEFEEIDNDSPFNGEMYKAYTKTGKRLDYVVWPPVFLHKNGPLLSKGVAQGK